MAQTVVVIPTWNGAEDLPQAIDSILAQSHREFELVVVDNGSIDDSRKIIEAYRQKDSRLRSIYLDKNYGYTGGVNPGMELAIEEGAEFVAPFNNDAVADKDWLKYLVEFLRSHPSHGIAACTILHADGKTIDSTADQYTIWGIPFPRGRDEPAESRHGHPTEIFGASGGASLFRISMLRKIGVYDQDFFAYYEDIDLSFRAQLAGWKVAYVPAAIVRHNTGQTSARLAGRQKSGNKFLTKQYMKNLPFILVKDMPAGLFWRVLPRFFLAYKLILLKAVVSGRGLSALAGALTFWIKLPKKLLERRSIQKSRTVTNDYLWGLFVHDLPPNAMALRKLRAFWRGITGDNQ
jgi:GT2 family glycosyltransferase